MNRFRLKVMGNPRKRLLPRQIVLVAFLNVLACFPSSSAPYISRSPFHESWRWAHFDHETGLPLGQIRNLLDMKDGNVWVQTSTGIAWFDGFRWRPLAGDSLLLAQLTDGWMAPDSNGVLIATRDSLYKVKTSSVQRIPIVFQGSPVTALRAVRLSGGELIIQSEKQLYRMIDGVVRPFPSPYKSPSPTMVSEVVHGITSPRGGGLWLNTLEGIFRWDGNDWCKVVEPPRGAISSTVFAVNERGIGAAEVETNGVHSFLHWENDSLPVASVAVEGQTIISLDVSPDGTVLALTAAGEIRIKRNGEWSVLDPLPSPVTGAQFLRYRSDGALWVHNDLGLHLCRVSDSLWTNITTWFPDAGYSVNDMLRARDGSLWWATSWGVRALTREGAYRQFTELDNQQLTVVTGVAEDTEGKIWICSGTSFTGAYCWNGASWKHFGESDGLPARNIHRIARDRTGRLWFLTIATPPFREEQGAFVYDQGGFLNLGVRDGLPDGRVYAMAQDSTGAMWFGTLTSLSRLRDGKWTYWSTSNGLRADKVFTLLVDRNNRLWFGHQKQGLGYIDKEDHPCYIRQEDGLESQEVWSLAMDERGRLWVSSRGGIIVQGDSAWTTITASHGLPNSYLWPLLPIDRTILIGTQGSGIVAFRYGALATIAPQVFFREPLVRRNETVIGWNAYAYWGSVAQEKLETRYRVDEGPWSAWGAKAEITLLDVSWGDHTIEVQGKGLLAEVTTPPARLDVNIPPPLFLRPYVLVPFLSLALLLVGTATIFYIRKREYDRELRRQDARYRAVVEHQSELIARVTPDWAVSFVNEAFSRFFDRRREQLIGRGLDTLLSPSDYESLRRFATLSTRVHPAEYEHILTRVDGEPRWIHWSVAPIFEVDGTTTEIQLVGSDITQQKHAHKELEEKERRYRIVAEQTGQLVYDHDISSGLIRWSGAVQEVTGYPTEEFQRVSTREWEELIHPDDRTHASESLRTCLATKEPYQIEYRFKRNDNAYITVFDNGVAVDDGPGTPVRMLGTITNITARKQAEEQIAASLKEKEVLVKEVHHRVKNNLQIISSLLNFQALSLADPKALEQLHESQDRIRSMALVHERLYQSGNLADISYGEYVRDLAHSLFRSYNVKNIRLFLSIQEVRLGVNTAIPCGLILNELISNALKHAFPGGIEGDVEVTFALADNHSYVLTVKDNGVGFPPDVDFRNSPGLGLQLVNTLTAQVDGTLDMKQQGGTTFTLVFPSNS